LGAQIWEGNEGQIEQDGGLLCKVVSVVSAAAYGKGVTDPTLDEQSGRQRYVRL